MNEAVVADRDGDVRGAAPFFFRVEEDEVARFDVGWADLVADFVLFFDDARHGDAVLRKDILHEPAAVEPARIGTA